MTAIKLKGNTPSTCGPPCLDNIKTCFAQKYSLWSRLPDCGLVIHHDVIKWKHVPRYWPFVHGIHWSPVNSPHKGQWCGAHYNVTVTTTWQHGYGSTLACCQIGAKPWSGAMLIHWHFHLEVRASAKLQIIQMISTIYLLWKNKQPAKI